MKIDKLDLLSKGWSVSEIEHASKIIEEAENKKHIGIRFLDKSIYWALLFLLLLGNIICSIFLIPFIFAIKNFFAIIMVAIIGFIFGMIFSILISDIERTEYKNRDKHILTLIISGVINVGLIINFTKDFSTRSNLKLIYDPYYVSIVYLIAFLIPHIVYLIFQKKEK